MKLSECEWREQRPETLNVSLSGRLAEQMLHIQTKLGQPMTLRTTKVPFQCSVLEQSSGTHTVPVTEILIWVQCVRKTIYRLFDSTVHGESFLKCRLLFIPVVFFFIKLEKS